MIHLYLSIFVCLLTVISCTEKNSKTTSDNYEYKLDTLTLLDSTRNRNIPIAIWTPKNNESNIVIFSHGYGFNKGDDYLAYSYLTEFLASKGYLVVSIQHELKTDSLLPLTGNPQIVRRPFWNRGVKNIEFVINYLKSKISDNKNQEIYLIGHSNGGDITALFPQINPNIVQKIITLDNVRMPLPKTEKLQVFSLRSNDQPADKNVLPNSIEQEDFNIKIIELEKTGHNEMDDNGNDTQKTEIKNLIFDFLKE